jgi:hypothetical protein
MPTFFKEDLEFIESEVSRVMRQEIKTRMVLPVKTDYDPNASFVGYDIYDITGSAKILANGGKDIPFVGENKRRESTQVFKIGTGIRYTEEEREGVASARANGKGGVYNLDSERPATARRYIYEEETRLAFVGDDDYGVKGLFNDINYGVDKGTKEDVATGAGASTLWSLKTPAEILADIRKGVKNASKNGLFPGEKMCLLPYDQYFDLTQPYADGTTFTILDWLQKSIPMVKFDYFEIMKAGNNGDTDDYMLIYTKDVRLLNLAITRDIRVGRPVFDIIETSEQAVTEKTAGTVVKHPASLYIGKKI